MKQLGWVFGALSLSFLVVACGGHTSTPEGTRESGGTSSAAGSPSNTEVAGAVNGGGAAVPTEAGAPGVGPIDSTKLAAEFPEPLCFGPLASLHLALPCKVGMPAGGLAVVECYDTSGRTALNFGLDLESAAQSIGTPVPVGYGGPDPGGTPALSVVPPITIEVAGVEYQGVLKGSLTFEQVDPEGREFVAFLTREFIAWTAPDGTETDCVYDPMRLWATAGDFL